MKQNWNNFSPSGQCLSRQNDSSGQVDLETDEGRIYIWISGIYIWIMRTKENIYLDIADEGGYIFGYCGRRRIYIWILQTKEDIYLDNGEEGEYIFGNISSLLSIKHNAVPIKALFH